MMAERDLSHLTMTGKQNSNHLLLQSLRELEGMTTQNHNSTLILQGWKEYKQIQTAIPNFETYYLELWTATEWNRSCRLSLISSKNRISSEGAGCRVRAAGPLLRLHD